eukprot:PhM_4_TR393/c0_g2_i1/m.90709/K00101/lldD; L-lactate dehydrogenase (cytochrome)
MSVSSEELSRHSSREDCWVAIRGHVYDVTAFASDHPGGAEILYKYGGKDATSEFDMLHAPMVLDSFPKDKIKGTYTAQATKPKAAEKPSKEGAAEPHLGQMVNIRDFWPIAQKNMTTQGWVYYATAAEDEITLQENEDAFLRYTFRPRVLVDVSVIDTRTTILGVKTTMPLFICATALVGLCHPDGEVGLTRAAATEGVIQMVPCFSSKPLKEIAAARAPDQVQFFQLYVNSDRKATEKLVKEAEALGFHALFVTVDAPKLGRREKDMRQKFSGTLSVVHSESSAPRNEGVAKALNSMIAADLTWRDITWLRSITKMKIVLKGVQRGDDAVKAARMGVDGLLLSNHGGRQMDGCRAAIDVLIEVTAHLRRAKLVDKVELYIDGGIRRGNDIAKAIALGARAVGFGRPPAMGLAAFGQAGAEKVLRIMKDELQNSMALLGARNLAGITRDMVLAQSGREFIGVNSKI